MFALPLDSAIDWRQTFNTKAFGRYSNYRNGTTNAHKCKAYVEYSLLQVSEVVSVMSGALGAVQFHCSLPLRSYSAK